MQNQTHRLEQEFELAVHYPVIFTREVFATDNTVLRDFLQAAGDQRHRVLVVIDSGVLDAHPGLPQDIASYAGHYPDVMELVGQPFIVRGGEVCKTDPHEVDAIWALVERHRICRHSYVIVIGGGSVLDAAGYAVATVHRGLRLIRMPTTVLSQNDAGVGVKNGINYHGKKNFIGTFSPPSAVINDSKFLNTLDPRDLRSGIAEAIKVALIRDAVFFDYLEAHGRELAQFNDDVMREMIERCARLHLDHIREGGDPYEYGSARPLDFGHWSAHKLEQLSDHVLRHGEAVAIGIAIDAVYSFHAGLLSETDMERVVVLLQQIGFDLNNAALGLLDVQVSLSDFQEHLGGVLTITLLSAIGQGIDVHEIDVPLMQRSVQRIMR
ncbi:MAG: 3-dehydroquinate synthase [Gammaproteobacteria bacterium]|nr:3-dehydroquinate synthase [Gammaproteobacteria bacterium]